VEHTEKVRPQGRPPPGDLVFFKEAGWSRPITHVGIYSGRENLVHASNFFGKVVESKMRYMRGYYGAKRIRWR
jgi:cell wall-associated NlpC family hydrolase